MFYVGSGTLANVNEGYKGSVSSKKYKKIWFDELNVNPHLFRTKIVAEYATRREAYRREGELQRKLDVIRSPMYVNMSYASEDAGFTCIQQTGVNNTMYGKKQTPEHLAKRSTKGKPLTKPRTPKHAKKIGDALRGRKLSVELRHKLSELKQGEKHNMFGKPKTDDIKAKIAATKRGSKWWTNGIEAKTSHVCPGDGWQLGRKLKQEHI